MLHNATVQLEFNLTLTCGKLACIYTIRACNSAFFIESLKFTRIFGVCLHVSWLHCTLASDTSTSPTLEKFHTCRAALESSLVYTLRAHTSRSPYEYTKNLASLRDLTRDSILHVTCNCVNSIENGEFEC